MYSYQLFYRGDWMDKDEQYCIIGMVIAIISAIISALVLVF